MDGLQKTLGANPQNDCKRSSERQRTGPPHYAENANKRNAASTHQGTFNWGILTTKLMFNYKHSMMHIFGKNKQVSLLKCLIHGNFCLQMHKTNVYILQSTHVFWNKRRPLFIMFNQYRAVTFTSKRPTNHRALSSRSRAEKPIACHHPGTDAPQL